MIGHRLGMKTSTVTSITEQSISKHIMTALLQRIGAPSRASSTFKTFSRCVANSASKEILGTAGSPKPSQAIPYQEANESTPKELWQAPNHPGTWSSGQNPRPHAMSGPRFEQRDLRFQAAPFAAIDAVAQDPIRLVDGRRATCDGGG
jgi:NADH dehydrogenase (ubiquinone) Fe-S protein 6